MIFSGDKVKFNITIHYVIPYKLIPDFNVLGLRIQNRVVGYCNSRCVVTVNRYFGKLKDIVE